MPEENWHLRPELEFTDGVDSWNVRTDPELDAFCLCTIQAGQPFAVTGTQGDWVQVRTENGVRGWCYKKFNDKDALVPVNSAGVLEPQPQSQSPKQRPVLQRQRSREQHVSGLLLELEERRRSLEAATTDAAARSSDKSSEVVCASSAVEQTMAKLELLGIEKEQLLTAEGTEALASVRGMVENLSQELNRSTSYKHSDFQNPAQSSCWLSTFFQSLWHTRVFHTLFDCVVRPLPSQGKGSAADALRETWELYERSADTDQTVPVQALVAVWGEGYGDCAEAFAKLQGEPALEPLVDLFAMVPILPPDSGSTLTPTGLWQSVLQMQVSQAPLIALDLMLPSMPSSSILTLALGLMPRHRELDSLDADLGDSHRLAAVICYMETFEHYVVFCRRQSSEHCWLLFNDLPGLSQGIRRQLSSWAAVAHECARFELRPKVLLYESHVQAQRALQADNPTLRASLQAAAVSKRTSTHPSRLFWGFSVCFLMVVVAVLVQHLLGRNQGFPSR